MADSEAASGQEKSKIVPMDIALSNFRTWVSTSVENGRQKFWQAIKGAPKNPPAELTNVIREIAGHPAETEEGLLQQGVDRQAAADIVTLCQSTQEPVAGDIEAARRLLEEVKQRANIPDDLLTEANQELSHEATSRLAQDLLQKKGKLTFPGTPSGTSRGDKDRREEEKIKRSRAWVPEAVTLTIFLGLLSCCCLPKVMCGLASGTISGIREARSAVNDPDLNAILAAQRNLEANGEGRDSYYINLYTSSQQVMTDIVGRKIKGPIDANALDDLVNNDRFNPEDGFNLDEISRARGWTNALRPRYIRNNQFMQRDFIKDMKANQLTEDSLKRFLDKYDKFLDSIDIKIISHLYPSVPPKDLPQFAEGTSLGRELRRPIPYGPVAKSRVKEMRSYHKG